MRGYNFGIKVSAVFILVLITAIPYLLIHMMTPTILWLDRIANSLSTLSTKGPIATHSATAYFFFLAPFLAGGWSWIIAWLRQKKPTAVALGLGCLGAWLGWSASVWMTQSYRPFGYFAGPNSSLWIPVLAGLPPMQPTTSYFMALGMSAFGAVAFTAVQRRTIVIFALGVGLLFCGITTNGFLIKRGFKIARTLASEQPANMKALAHYAIRSGRAQRAAINRLKKELEAYPEQAGVIVPLIAQAAESGGHFVRINALSFLTGYGFKSEQTRQAVRRQAEAANVLLDAGKDYQLGRDFRLRNVRSLGWFRVPGVVDKLERLLRESDTEEDRIAFANALALQGNREGLVISLESIKETGSADYMFLRGIAESGSEDLIAFVDKYVFIPSSGTPVTVHMHSELLRRGRLESIEPMLRVWLGFHSSEGSAALRLPRIIGSTAASVPFLIHALDSREAVIQSYALQELRILSNQLPSKPIGSDNWSAQEWITWWQEDKQAILPVPTKQPPSIQLDPEEVRRSITEVEQLRSTSGKM